VCGIAGIVGATPGADVSPALVHQMCQTIIHRGPDDEGIYAKGPVGLGMRRLSIIDLASGHQPIHNEDKTIWVVFNGEIYNFPELRKDLIRSGHHFYTDCDTEVIVHLYEDCGAECIQKLRGMFAFALYDENRSKLLLARDRLGKKPLHYAMVDNRLLFGSEIKSLLSAAPELRQIDQEGLLQFFYFGYIPDPYTSFSRVRKLPPGHLLEFEQGKVIVKQYWDLPAYGTHNPASEEECLEELEQRLSEAVRIRLNSDVPLGALLSGGVDSSTIVALMARASSKPVKTFSVGFDSHDFNEVRYARLVAKRFGTEHHELIIEPNIGDALNNLAHTMEEPFADSSMLPTYFVSCLARQHVTVALSGDGGDELFAGYDRYQVNLRRRIFDLIPNWASRRYREFVYPLLPCRLRDRKFTYNISLPSRERYLHGLSFLPAGDYGTSVFSDGFLAWAKQQVSPLNRFRDYYDHGPAQDPISQLLYLDTKTYLTSDILTKVDRMSMATSLEVRVPILDHIFVEWVTSLPAHWKLRGDTQKYIFKKLAERVGVPREVLYRRKQGFSMPLVHWLRRGMTQELVQMLLEPRTLQRGYFDSSAIRELVNDHLRERRDNSGEIWLLLIFELWHRNFLEANLSESMSTPNVAPSLSLAACGESQKFDFVT
jgi:asparagine synthase (glutamine-hydrolysing)